MLTDEQIEVRRTGIGASEVAAVLDMAPFSGPLDVWMEKTGNAKKRKAESILDPSSVGSFLEDGLLRLYGEATGRTMVAPHTTLRHPSASHVLSSPDGVPAGGPIDHGLELKLVGHRMAHHWAGDTIPDYVQLQAQQNMAVTGAARWDVLALIGGTTLMLRTLERDQGLIDMVLESVEHFWAAHVETLQPPEQLSVEDRARAVAHRFPEPDSDAVPWDGDEDLAELVRWRSEADRRIAELEAFRDEATVALCERTAERRGLEGAWGRFLWYPVRGRVNWEAVAQEVAAGAIPAELVERHRGEGHRVPRLYPPKKTPDNTKRTRTKR